MTSAADYHHGVFIAFLLCPPLHCDEVPEPLVGQLVGDDLGDPLAVAEGGGGFIVEEGDLPGFQSSSKKKVRIQEIREKFFFSSLLTCLSMLLRIYQYGGRDIADKACTV